MVCATCLNIMLTTAGHSYQCSGSPDTESQGANDIMDREREAGNLSSYIPFRYHYLGHSAEPNNPRRARCEGSDGGWRLIRLLPPILPPSRIMRKHPGTVSPRERALITCLI